jgi:hypothetical protein
VDGDVLAVALAAGGEQRDLAAAGQVVRCDAVGAGEELVERSLADDLTAVDAGARAHVDDMVGGADRLLVMFDDEHGVAEPAQALEGLEQAVVVLLVKADRRLVEDIEDAGEAGADLRREADALALAARERAAGAVEVEIVEADIMEKAEALVDLLEDGLGDLVLGGGELFVQAREPFEGVGDASAAGEADVLAGDLHGQRLGLEAGAVADLAGL